MLNTTTSVTTITSITTLVVGGRSSEGHLRIFDPEAGALLHRLEPQGAPVLQHIRSHRQVSGIYSRSPLLVHSFCMQHQLI
jgi:hypothetical protein